MSEITLLETSKFSVGRTAALGVLLLPVAYLIFAAIALSSMAP